MGRGRRVYRDAVWHESIEAPLTNCEYLFLLLVGRLFSCLVISLFVCLFGWLVVYIYIYIYIYICVCE